MLTNNKKSFFVKGIALLMAMLMVLSVCLTGCGKAAEEAAKNAQDTADKAVTDAAAAQSAADAVKKELEKYFTSEQTKTEAGKLIEEALKAYTTTEGLAAYVKSDDFDALVAQLNDYVKADAVNAAIAEALEGKVTAAELEAIQKQLSADIKKNQTAIADAVESLKGYATDAEIAAIKTALENKIAATDAAAKEAKEALKGYLTAAQVDDIKAALEKKIADGDAFAQNALKDYVKAEDLSAIQTALNDKIAATDKAVANAVASLKDYVKADDEYARLVSSVQEMTFKLQTIDRDHYVQIMQELAPYIENQEALAEAVTYLTDELAKIDKKHHDHVVELLADYVATADYENLVAAVQRLDTQLSELHMNVYNELTKYVTVENFENLAARVEALAGALEEIRVNANTEIAALTKELGLVEAAVQRLDAALSELHMNVYNELAKHDATLKSLFDMIEQHKIDTRNMGKEIQGALVNYATKVEVDALEGRLDRLEEVVRGILNAFYTPEEVKTFAEEGFDILDVDPAIIAVQFQNKMNTVDGSMSLADWNATTTKILVETIDNIQKLLERLYENTDGLVHNNSHVDAYLYARKMEINSILAPLYTEAFDPATGDLNDSYVVRKGLEYAVLRSANAAELLKKSEALAAAIAVNTFADDLAELYNEYLYTIGCADDTHHKDVQIVTIEHKGEINTFADKFDELIISYLFDTKGNAFEDTKYMAAGNFGNQPTMGVYRVVATNAYITIDDDRAEIKDAAGKKVLYTRVGDTIIFDGDYMPWKAADAYGLYYLPTNMIEFQWSTAALKDVTVKGFHGSKNDISVPTATSAWGTYKSVIDQTYDAQDLINTANAKFQQFLNEVVRTYGVSKSVDDFKAKDVTMNSYAAANYDVPALAATKDIALNTYDNISKIDDMQFLYALSVDMCTLVKDSKIDGPISIYLTGEDSVQYYMEKALARNTCADEDHNKLNHTETLKYGEDGAYRYDLYQKMIDKAWFLTFELYRTYAYDMSVNILADYISALDYAIANPTVDPNAIELGNIDTFLLDYDVVGAGNLADGFLDAFLNDDHSTFTGWSSNEVDSYSAIKLNKDFGDLALKYYYGDLNNVARDPNGNLIKADPIATMNTKVNAQTLAEYIRQYLTSASVYPQLAIMNADRAEAYASNRNDIAAVFVEILESCVAGFDEVYSRFLLEDYEKVLINKAWDYATYTANFFCLDTESATLIKAMQNHLTASDATGAKVKLGDKNFLYYDLLDKELKEGGTYTLQLPNGAMYTELFAITADKFAYIGALAPVINIADKTSDSYVNSATNKRDLAEQVLGRYMNVLDNMAVKYNFLNYLDDATQNLVRAQLNYMKAQNEDGNFVLTYDMINRLVMSQNGHNSAISIEKFQHEMGKIPFNQYKVRYAQVLTKIAGEKQMQADRDHLAKILNKSVDNYIYNSANADAFDATIGILSTTDKVWVDTALNNVVRPVDVLDTGDFADLYIGTAVWEFDSIVNVNTKYYPNGDTTKIPVNLY